MAGVGISVDNPRSTRAVAIAAGAEQWITISYPDGRKAYGVPSQTGSGRFYAVDENACTCNDFTRYGKPCKHVLAVRLHAEIVKAQPRRRKGGEAHNLSTAGRCLPPATQSDRAARDAAPTLHRGTRRPQPREDSPMNEPRAKHAADFDPMDPSTWTKTRRAIRPRPRFRELVSAIRDLEQALDAARNALAALEDPQFFENRHAWIEGIVGRSLPPAHEPDPTFESWGARVYECRWLLGCATSAAARAIVEMGGAEIVAPHRQPKRTRPAKRRPQA